jgi:hypothetical protein
VDVQENVTSGTNEASVVIGRETEAIVRHYTLKKTAVVLTLASLVVIALWALGLLRTGAVAY